MAGNRFFLSAEKWNDNEPLVLEGDEARHCAEVLRARPGDRIGVFDGAGREALGELVEVDQKSVTVKVVSTNRSQKPATRIVLAQAVTKGKSMDLIVQKATELGVSEIIPVLSERTVVKLESAEAEKKVGKWERVVLEACKQCVRNWLPKVSAPKTMAEVVSERAGFDLLLIASLQPDRRGLKEILQEQEELNGSRPKSVLVLVGPEGDYTPAEYSLARGEGFLPLGLGDMVLRSETAAIHCLSILVHELLQTEE